MSNLDLKKPSTNQSHYLAGAKDWESDEIARVKTSERRAWRVAMGAGAIALVSVIAVAGLTPLKTVEPFVVRVDKIGAADTVTLLNERTVTGSEAIDKYWLARYVNYREEYSPSGAYGNFKATELLSSPSVGSAYYAQIRPDNPSSPTNVYRDKGIVDVEVTSVTFIGQRHAQVRYVRREKRDGPATVNPSETSWIATINYEYVNPPMTEAARLVNPVGFRVTEYRVDPETVEAGR